MQGILLVDKPAEWTSFDVVNYVRRMVATVEGKKAKNCKVGHTGTLDPFATGLLVLLVGKEYTRKAAELSKVDKTYEVTMRLGEASSTGDPEGEITIVSDTIPSHEAVTEDLNSFKGQIEQVPPAFSAIKVNGKRAYELARQGKEVTLEPRKVTIYDIELTKYSYPEVQFTARVSSGTYVRTLVEDIGAVLKTGAYTTQLRRTSVGQYTLAGAVNVQDMSPEHIAKKIKI